MLTVQRHDIVLFKNRSGPVALSVCAGLELRPVQSMRSQFQRPRHTSKLLSAPSWLIRQGQAGPYLLPVVYGPQPPAYPHGLHRVPIP